MGFWGGLFKPVRGPGYHGQVRCTHVPQCSHLPPRPLPRPVDFNGLPILYGPPPAMPNIRHALVFACHARDAMDRATRAWNDTQLRVEIDAVRRYLDHAETLITPMPVKPETPLNVQHPDG